MKKRWLVAAVILLVVAATVGAVSRLVMGTPSVKTTATPEPAPTPVGDSDVAPTKVLDPFYHQTLSWTSCRDGALCAELTVPMNYADPGGPTIAISVLKVAASDPSRRIGALVVNPGGPGVPGTSLAEMGSSFFGSKLAARFDIVGFDPRGTGASDPIECVSAQQMTALLNLDPSPDTPAEAAATQNMSRAFGQGCVTKGGPLASHVSTVEAARDMDVLRAVLGEQRLTYYGASYGTKLGSTYAALFPKRVGRFVLDGAVDPKLTAYESALGQAEGFQTALNAYVGHCVSQGHCFLGSTVQAGLAKIKAFVDSVGTHPLPAGSRRLTEGEAFVGVLVPLYSRSSWAVADIALKAAFAGDGTDLLAFADAYASRRGDTTYTNNEMQAISAINCLDDPTAVNADKIPALYPAFLKVAPTFGEAFAWMLNGCIGQVAKAAEKAPDVGVPGTPPIVVIGTTRDPATPYQWAVNLAHDLSSGVLVTRDGDGHTAFRSGNKCIDNAVYAYFIDGTVPANGLRC